MWGWRTCTNLCCFLTHKRCPTPGNDLPRASMFLSLSRVSWRLLPPNSSFNPSLAALRSQFFARAPICTRVGGAVHDSICRTLFATQEHNEVAPPPIFRNFLLSRPRNVQPSLLLSLPVPPWIETCCALLSFLVFPRARSVCGADAHRCLRARRRR